MKDAMNHLENAVIELEQKARDPQQIEMEGLDDLISRMKAIENRLNAVEKRMEQYEARKSGGGQ